MSEPQVGTEPTASRVDSALDIVAEVAGYLGTGIEAEDTRAAMAGACQRGLWLSRCRFWTRDSDDAPLHVATSPGDPPPTAEERAAIARWLDSPARSRELGGAILIPLIHDGATLGLLEAVPSERTPPALARRILDVIGNMLSPLLASTALSEDLAGEVALRTREIDAQRRFTAQIIDSLPVGLYVIDRDYRIQAWNRKRETGTQGVVRDEVLGRAVFDVLHRQPGDLLRREFDHVFRTGRMEQLEVESTASGEPRYYRLTKIPMRLEGHEVTHVITIGEDVTDWKSVQHQISQTEKLAAVGQLAAGVMHEINNPLATITACLDALAARSPDLPLPSRHAFEEYFRIIESELERCKRIVDGLLDFSRPKARFKKLTSLNQIVEDALFLVKHHDRFKAIRLIRRLAEGLPEVQTNAEQLIQAFLAIMLNAIDAMEGDGVLTVATGFNAERSDELVVEFSDTGPGIAREHLPKIFEPFFTTKAPGQGTGLGLSICYGIVAEHGGRLSVESLPGRGTLFRMFLPIAGRAESP